jgi:hypothetical protein
MIQYSRLGRTLYLNELTRLCAREDYIESRRRESFKTYKIEYNLCKFTFKLLS